MGRANNSFTGYVGQAAEINSEDKVDLPEKSLWIAVLCRAALDAVKGPPSLNMQVKANISHKNCYNYNKRAAQHFFLEGGTHFELICELAGRNPKYVQARIKKVLLRKSGWNVDVPITSYYRGGIKRRRGRPKKKHLMGNAYYAAKAAKEMKAKNIYYAGMGAKGGRPRIYNGI